MGLPGGVLRGSRTQWDLLIVWGQLHGLAGELCVKVVQTVVVCDLWLEWRERLLLLQLAKTRQKGPAPRGHHPYQTECSACS